MLRLAGVSASPRPLVTSGMALASPPVPVVVVTPVPSRRNQHSTVKVLAPRDEAVPKVTWSLTPSSFTPVWAWAPPLGISGNTSASARASNRRGTGIEG